MPEKLEDIAVSFYKSFYDKKWNGKETSVKALSIEEAYEVQNLVAKMRVASGERVVGYKVGCTSPAIRKQFDLANYR